MDARMAPVLLVASLAALAWFHRNDVRGFGRFRAIEGTEGRQRAFLRWTRNACALYLGVPLIGLALLGRLDALLAFPDAFAVLTPAMPDFRIGSPLVLGLMAGALFGGGALGAMLRLGRRRPARPVPGLDITAMLPRNRAELLRVVPLVVNAGIGEEIFFRLYLPLLIVLSGGAPAFAFIASTLIFGLLHRYQGWLGAALATLLAALFAALYLGTGGLAAPILVHLLIDFNALVLRPAIALRFHARPD
ncbi:CPBP family intramembrane metalloprotease [Sphingomonas sp. CBMAI 2297]|uniref:CPBP family intramembrane glutamic endopeptidase n=1 Tax=Sphingomonas sp. CBMAI 2297 TaxID=2991720 RepID=UPI0024574EEC|nr:CPBP family intramembrane metalloprotease [Sphingomonas sp. CBMAI 2297]MDH4742770.1 CPBP family intramembrane metalloprotease [Sphingomonas sp. CBMAI 2297]